MSRFRSAASVCSALSALVVLLFAAAIPGTALAQDLVVDAVTITLGGEHRYVNVRVINGGRIEVPDFNGSDRANTKDICNTSTSKPSTPRTRRPSG